MLQLDSPGTVSYLRAFLFKTAANIAIDRLRFRKVEVRRAEGHLLDGFAASPSTEQYISDAEELRLTTAYIEELPLQYREALLLSRFEPLSTSEIAERMGISERTVQYYIVESLVYIRARLERAARPKPPRIEVPGYSPIGLLTSTLSTFQLARNSVVNGSLAKPQGPLIRNV